MGTRVSRFPAMNRVAAPVAALVFTAVFLIAVFLTAAHAAIPLPPELTQPVNDFAHVIDAQSAAALDQRIRALKAASGDVVVVATVDTYAPYADITDYAVKMFENHGRGIGDKGKDNGVLVVVAVKDRKVRVEVGYDLEQFITDGYAGEISRTYMAPAFARGEYGAGVLAGTNQVIARIAQARGVTITGVPAPTAVGGGAPLPISSGMIVFLMIVFFILNLRSRRAGYRGGRWGRGGWSGWNSGVGPFGGGGGFGGGGFGGGFGGFGGGRSGGGGGGASW
jgi:uncharacterized protein